ncbi:MULTISPECIES: transcriptional regulator [Candidatus Nitrosocaldus]|jgi:uncharacterized membrane protein YgcG|uniref:Transcriptional regulator n=1 Tax=Candidatus Nitrosocaldus cavascurensis TaxID=2058097 RepID=A0A2K5APC4_9ARCH|nr:MULTISPECIES: transcriptional regulator [Candidatus Nitrosocaldus]SPC33492.1 conserved protein of unknown function [Candidatus Nitrosocaldus cavascurensis]
MQHGRRAMGIVVFVTSIAAFMLYAWLLLASEWSLLIIKYTTLMLVACITGIFAWLGLSIAIAKSKSSRSSSSSRSGDGGHKG